MTNFPLQISRVISWSPQILKTQAAGPKQPALTQHTVHHAEVCQENIGGKCPLCYKNSHY